MSSSLKKNTTRQSASVLKREQILAGARHVFLEYGYKGASMENIASCAGVSKGTLYNYFSHKAELFSAFVKLECEKRMHLMLLPLRENIAPEKTLHSIAQAFLTLLSDKHTLNLFRLILSEAQNFPHIGQVFWDNAPQVAITMLTKWIRRQNEEGTLKADDPTFAAEQFLSLCQTRIIARRRLNIPVAKSAQDEKIIIDKAVEVFLAAYGAPSKS